MRTYLFKKLPQLRQESEVVELARDFLGEWRPEELAEIPQACRPGKIRDAEDIGDLAFELTRHRMKSDQANARLVEMETFFAHAAARLSALDSGSLHSAPKQSSSESA